MSDTTLKLAVAKCTDEELESVRVYLQELDDVLRDNECYDEEDYDVNKEIADVARKFPDNAFIVRLNLSILLNNYQDKESHILEHPEWIKKMIDILQNINETIIKKQDILIRKDSIFHNRIKALFADDKNDVSKM